MLKLSLRGDMELIAKLRALSKPEFKAATQTGAKKSLEPIQKTARAIAPKNTGKLRRAIRIRVLKRSRKRVGARVTVGAHESMFKGKTFYAGFQEYGWRTGRRKSNQDLGVAFRKRRTAEQRAEIDRMNAARKKIRGHQFLKKATWSNYEIVMVTFRGHIKDGIDKVMKKKLSKLSSKYLPVI